MCPFISSARTRLACSAASSGVSANWTPPAFMRPPVSTCDLITTEPPMRCAAARASSTLVAKPKSVTGIPARFTILRDSYSKNLISHWSGLEPVGLGELGNLLGQELSERDHHLTLL